MAHIADGLRKIQLAAEGARRALRGLGPITGSGGGAPGGGNLGRRVDQLEEEMRRTRGIVEKPSTGLEELL